MTSRLEPVSVLKCMLPFACPAEMREYRLRSNPQSLHEFIALFNKKNPETLYSIPNPYMVVWISDGIFVRILDYRALEEQHAMTTYMANYQKPRHTLQVQVEGSWCFPDRCCVLIHGLQQRYGDSGFKYLATLPDSHYTTLKINDGSSVASDCFITRRAMKKMLEKSPTRRHDFYHLIFRPDQSHVLGAAATANIGLLFCEFSDKGEAFLTAYRQKEESDTTCRYSFSGELPFEATVWLDFLKQPRRFETLELNWFFYGYSETMNGEALDHALCSSKRATLILAQHEFTDGGSALIDCIKSKTSCRSIVVDRCNDFSFGKFDWNPTFEALRGCDNHLKEVELVLPWSVLQDRPTSAFYPSLVGALLKNMGLKRLVLRNVHTNDRENVILSLIPHRTLRYLTIDNPSFEWKWGVEVKAFTYKIVSLLEANECLEHIDVPKYSIDPGVWKALVVPKLKANCERNRLVDVSRIKRASLRAAVLGAVLVKESKDPSKFWSSIVMNQDTVLQFLSYVEYCNVRQENKKKTRTHQQQGKTTLPDRTAGGSKVKKLNEHTGLPHQEGPNHKRNDEKDCKQAEVPCFHLLGFLQNIFPKKQSALV